MTRKAMLPDEQVITVWECPDCGDTSEADVTSFQEVGTPVCSECDTDMAYSHVYLEMSRRDTKVRDAIGEQCILAQDATKLRATEEGLIWYIDACDENGRCVADEFRITAIRLAAKISNDDVAIAANEYARIIGRPDLVDSVEIVDRK